MTKIKYRPKPIWRMSDAYHSGRAICIGLEPTAIVLRLFGTKTTLRMPIESAFWQAAVLEARRIRAEKEKARKARKAGR